jgi:hypothetical protein
LALIGRATQLCDGEGLKVKTPAHVKPMSLASLPPANSRARRAGAAVRAKGRRQPMTLMLNRSRFAARNIKAGSATEEREMSGSLIETVLVQIACASKDILPPASIRKRQI